MKIARRRDSKLPGIRTLRKLYVTDEMTLKEIAGLYNSSASVVLYHLRKYNIPIRDRAEASRLSYSSGKRTPKVSPPMPQAPRDGKMRCRRCGVTKSVGEFRVRTDTRNGYNSTCLQCSGERGKLWAQRESQYKRGLLLCSKCEEWKLTDQFRRDANGFRGYAHKCRRCASTNVEYYDYLEERKALLANGKKYCPNCNRTKTLRCFHKHVSAPDGYSGICKLCRKRMDDKYLEENRDELKRRRLERGRNKRNKSKIGYALLPARQKAKRRAATQRRRARLRTNEGEYNAKQWRLLVRYYCPGRICICCKKKRKLAADHIVPVTKGGTSWITNIQPMCQSCNSKKRVRTIDFRFDGGQYAKTLMEIQ